MRARDDCFCIPCNINPLLGLTSTVNDVLCFVAILTRVKCVHLCVCVTGYQQANLIILPKHLANDFEAFCRKNPAPLPLLYRSQSGETACLPLAKNADIR